MLEAGPDHRTSRKANKRDSALAVVILRSVRGAVALLGLGTRPVANRDQ